MEKSREASGKCHCLLKIRTIQIAGALMLTAVLAMSFIQPVDPVRKNPGNLQTTIMGLELGQSVSEFFDLLGEPGSEKGIEYRSAFILGSKIDFAFMLFYNTFLLFIGLYYYRLGLLSRLRMILYVFLVVLALFSDFMENLVLLKILNGGISEVYEAIPSLQLFTILKWEALGLISAIIGFVLFALQKRGAAMTFSLSFFFALGGLVVRESIEYQSMFMAVGWIILWYRSLPFPNSWFLSESKKEELDV